MIYLVRLDFHENVEEIIKTLKDKFEVQDCMRSYGCTDTLIMHFFELNGMHFYNDVCVIDMDSPNINDVYYKDLYDKVKPFIRDKKLDDLGI